MVNKKKGGGKKRGAKKPPAASVSPVNATKRGTPSREKSAEDKPQTQDNVSQDAIVGLTRALVNWTAGLVIATIGLGLVAIFQWRELHKTDETLQRTLFVNQRPWLSVEAHLVGPFSFQEKEISVQMEILTKNYGQSPALKIRRFVHVLNNNERRMSILQTQEEACNVSLGQYLDEDEGEILFPAETKIERTNVVFDYNNIGGKTAKWLPTIIVCTAYSTALGNQNLKATNIFQLGRPDKLYPTYPVPFDFTLKPIPVEELVLRPIGVYSN